MSDPRGPPSLGVDPQADRIAELEKKLEEVRSDYEAALVEQDARIRAEALEEAAERVLDRNLRHLFSRYAQTAQENAKRVADAILALRDKDANNQEASLSTVIRECPDCIVDEYEDMFCIVPCKEHRQMCEDCDCLEVVDGDR